MGNSKCTLCHNTGWVLEAKQKPDGVVTLEIIPCLIPGCPKSGQAIELLSVNMLEMNSVAMHPKGDYIMSLRS